MRRSKRSPSETRGSRLHEIALAVQNNAAAKLHSHVSRMPRTRRLRIGPNSPAFSATLWNTRRRSRGRRRGHAPQLDPVSAQRAAAVLLGRVVADLAAAREASPEIGQLVQAASLCTPCTRIAEDTGRKHLGGERRAPLGQLGRYG